MQKDIRFVDCTLADFTEALVKGNGFGNDAVWIKDLFGERKFSIVEETVPQYVHNICQHIIKDFFEKKCCFKLLHETYYDESGEVAITFENLEINVGQYEKIYKNVFLIYEDKDGKKVCVSINKFSSREIIYRLYTEQGYEDILVKWFEYARSNNLYKNKKIDVDCNFLRIAEVGWNDIILGPKTIAVVRQQVDELFTYTEFLRANKIAVKRGVILAGPPGTGKTMLCKVLAKEIPVTVIYALPSQIEDAGDVRRLCEMAKDLAPTMMILEDIDYIAENRDESRNAGVVMELMNYMDGLQDFSDIVTLATTNAVDKIEEAVKNRPGRFDRVINIPKPTHNLRVRMLKLFTSNYDVNKILSILVKRLSNCQGLISGTFVRQRLSRQS